MSITKFRLNWRSNPQAQYDELQKMVMHLTNIASSMTDINIKLNVLPAIAEAIENQSLLLQAIMDNTNCACNALADVNSKLDEIIEIINTPVPTPVYEFEIYEPLIEITPEMIAAGSFSINGKSLKDGEIFNHLTLLDSCDFIQAVNVETSSKIFVILAPGVPVPEGLSLIQLQQEESGIVQQFELSYTAPVTAPNYIKLVNGTVIPLLEPSHISALCTIGDPSSTITIGSYTFYRNEVQMVNIVDGGLLPEVNVLPSNFCWYFSALATLILPETLTAIGDLFLHNCFQFSGPLDLSIFESLSTIGDRFLYSCRGFYGSLTLPSNLTSIGPFFMSDMDSFVGPLNLGSLSPDIFVVDDSTLSNDMNSVPSFVEGILVTGDNLNAFLERFPNRYRNSPFRNLLAPGMRFEPESIEFVPGADSFAVNLSAGSSWSFNRYIPFEGVPSDNLPDWLSLDKLSGNRGYSLLNFSVNPIPGVSQGGYVEFICDGLSYQFRVSRTSPVTAPHIAVWNVSGNDLEVLVARYPSPFDWATSYLYDIPAGLTYETVDSDNTGDDLVLGDDYMIYWRVVGNHSIEGSTLAANLRDGNEYNVGI